MAEVQNPYIAGASLSGTEMFFGRDDIFEFVRQGLASGHAIALYGQRRTGKTSVLNQLPRQLDDRYLCVFVSVHQLQPNGLNGFLWELARHVRRELDRKHRIALPALDRETFMADAHDAFRTLFLDQVQTAIGDRYLLLMVDEAVALQEQISAGRLERGVFDYLRLLMEHYPRLLRFLFALGVSLEDMEREYAILFSVGLWRKISFLERPVAEALITEPVRGCYELEPAAVARIYQTTSGHPYYTQLLCQTLFNRWRADPKPRLTEADVTDVLDEATESGSAALKNVWDDSTLGERVVMAGLAAAIGDEGREVRTADLIRFWQEHGLEMASGERVRAFKSLFGRDVLVGDDCPTFTVELQRRWVQNGGRPEWVRQEVADALEAETATVAAGVTGPIARNFTLLDPTPAPPVPVQQADPMPVSPTIPEPQPDPEPVPPLPRPPPPPTSWPRRLWAALHTYLETLSPRTLVRYVVVPIFILVALLLPPPFGLGLYPAGPAARPGTATPAPVATNETPVPAPAQAGVQNGGAGPSVSQPVGVAAASPAATSVVVTATPTAEGPASSASGASAAAPSGTPPTSTPTVLHGDDLNRRILDAADRAQVPRAALLALAQAETGRRSDLVEPATLEDAVKRWPAVYAGWARQRIAKSDLGELIPPPPLKREDEPVLQGAINVFMQPDLAGDRAAKMLGQHLPNPEATHDQMLQALIAYRAENDGVSPADVEAAHRGSYQEALEWAEAYVRVLAPPKPVSAAVTQPLPTATPKPSRFNPSEPTVLQNADWNDTPAVMTWMLRSLGHDVSLTEVERVMLDARVVTPDVGLLDASGRGLVQVIGTTWNEKGFNKTPVSFDEVAALAGRYPLAIGGRAWIHWSAVRGLSPEGDLVLANPAGSGPRYGQQRLNREQFAVLGAFTAVWIEP